MTLIQYRKAEDNYCCRLVSRSGRSTAGYVISASQGPISELSADILRLYEYVLNMLVI